MQLLDASLWTAVFALVLVFISERSERNPIRYGLHVFVNDTTASLNVDGVCH